MAMSSNFAAIDFSYSVANQSLDAKGYYQDGDYTFWEPTDETDLEPDICYGPGAMTVGELDNYDSSDCEEF